MARGQAAKFIGKDGHEEFQVLFVFPLFPIESPQRTERMEEEEKERWT